MTAPARNAVSGWRSLRTRALAVLATLVAALALLAVLVARRADDALTALDRTRFDAQTSQLADTISYAVLARSAPLLDAPVAAFAGSPDLVTVTVTDDEDHVLLTRSGAGATRSADVVVRVPVRTRAQPPGDDDPFAQELAAAARDVGTLTAVFSSEATRQVQASTRRSILVAVTAVGLVALVALSLLVTSVVARLRALQAAAARVRGGDLGATVDARGDDELASLAQDFNAMTASLHAQSQALAEREALATLGRATAVIAHELRNPLGIVLGAAGVAADPTRPESARTEAARIIADETQRLATTLDDLLSYAKPVAAQKSTVQVRALVDQVVARLVRAGGPAAGRTVLVRGDETRALGDAAQLERALWNLVQNAAQAGATQVTLTLARTAEGVEIAVADDGDGVPAEMTDLLFTPFSTSKQRGTGLGLAGARRGLRAADGDLRYAGAGLNGRGATFLVTLAHAQENG